MRELIKDIPTFPDHLLNEIDHGNVILFFGNGIYRAFGGHGWSGFANSIIRYCWENGALKDFSQCFRWQNDCSNPQKILYTLDLCKNESMKNNKINDYYAGIRLALPEVKKYAVVDTILDIKSHAIVTTNIDPIINEIYNIKSTDLKIDHLKNGKGFFQIHGDINRRESLVLTQREYYHKYENDDYIEFFKSIFDRTVLFIGYGINEYPINSTLHRINIKIGKNKAYTLRPWSAQFFNCVV